MAQSIQRHISHLKSSGSTAPSSGSSSPLIYGEIAVGYRKGDEALYIRNSSDEIVKFTTAANSQAIAELYTDKRVISTVTGDSVVSGSLSDIAESSNSGRTLTLTHKNNYATQSGFKKLTSDAYGHITGGEDVTTADLVGKGALSGVTADQGLSATTKADGSQKISHTNQIEGGTAQGTATKTLAHGDSFDIPSITYDTNGHITTVGKTTLTLPGADNAIVSVTGASGITATTSEGAVTVGHTNNVGAGSAQTTSTAVTATVEGANIDIPTIGYDAYGHITGAAVKNVSLKVNAASTSTAGVVQLADATGSSTAIVMTQSAVTAALSDKAASATSISGAVYDSNAKQIQFKNVAGTVISTIDATDFIKDGMVDSVAISDGNLVITFNEDAGEKEDIVIPLTSIFNPSNYYTTAQTSSSTEITAALALKSDTGHTHDDRYYTEEELTGASAIAVAKALSASTAATAQSVALTNVTDADDLKAIEALAGTSGILKKTAANTWTLDTTSYSSATQVETALSGKANIATTLNGYGITDAYTRDELTGNSAITVAKATSASTAASAQSVALTNVTNADDLKAIEALEGTSGLLKKTAANTWELDTNTYLTSAVQSVSLASGTNNGTLKLTVDGTTTDNVAVKGLGAAAFMGTGTTASDVAVGNHTHTIDQVSGDIVCGDYA